MFVFLAFDPSTLSTLAFLPLQKFEFDLRAKYCCFIRALSSDFNPLSYLHLWIGVVIMPPVPIFQCSGVLYESYDNSIPGNFISRYKLQI